MSRPSGDRIRPDSPDDYPYRLDLPTRWNDNDVYGHINNAVYYFYFDTVVNRWLIDHGLLRLGESETIGLVVDTGCSYFAPLAFPQTVTAGLRVSEIGNTSVRYEIGLFGEDGLCAARGHFVHVYVNEKTRRPVSMSDRMKRTLEELRL
ncbi:acyl-CoA thioesterase [Algimonas porphyrae]|uniref:Thioesterase n=1 Tax=Algimonas porphyrae TaxID=1128113 RepID=A0ABQ5V3P7_9PROT|nr:thioesterase family protein [Algimonas porphyrae]GLQ21344.1 thioesterase [Algimonas porphyrae]